MPELSGLDMLKTMENKPAVILTTAYSEYALESYEYGVTDYLMKPIRFDRFVKAINKVLKTKTPRVVESSSSEKVQNEEPKETHLFIKVDGVQQKVWLDDILYLESKGNFVQFHLKDRRLLTAGTLTSMAKRLSPSGFLRIHKSYIVNLDKVDRFNSKNVEVGTYEIPLSRNKKTQLVDALNNI